MRGLLAMALLLMSLGVAAATEAEKQETEARIKALQADMAQLQARMEQRADKQQALRQALKRSEQQISEVVARQRTLNQELAGLDTDLSQLKAHEAELEAALARGAKRIREQLRAQYQQGRQPRLQLMLSESDPARAERLLAYFDALNRTMAEQIDTYRQQLMALDQTRTSAAQTVENMADTRQSLTEQETALQAARAERESALEKLKTAQQADRERLARLEGDQKQLQALLKEIEAALERARLATANQAFDQLKGELPWPIKGRLSRRFGDKVNDLAYEGVLIKASVGEEVRAVHAGRVVFADWLRGYGLLLIIDHGGGYMSLYGHNQSLLRDTGTWVRAGEVVATSGESGGYEDTGLYFAIRHRGRSIDPGQWLAGL
ncbi:murein hydrolase activator EnvC family protein [Marinobacterium litorale]|uniref:murein hydrolase activator EnvC family protein n=1 Tax=Marinobacterium litorale TaxID=404770 RepID=UPI000413E941|nr:peptidoglycan DD-metalloendopeptidase family protein [Marinobacterium litorale]